MTLQSPVPIGSVFAGKYRVDRILGEGGMGIVVAAHHLELDQTVAVKFLLDDVARNAEGAERFRREARAAARIQSDHVVRVLDVGLLDSGERYMVMEYLDGHDLAEELRIHGRLPIDVAVRYLLEALDAIRQAHASGIIHRDLKPANLYLAKRVDGARRIKVLDFGISKSMSATTAEQLSLTRTSAWIGSPLYMAPEQMQSARDVDARADLWSLGAILYESISGQPPYPAESLPQLCNLMLTRDPQPLIELCPDVPAELNMCVMRCLSRSLEQRWQTATELQAALAAFAPTAPGRTTLASAVGLAATDVITGQGTAPRSTLDGGQALGSLRTPASHADQRAVQGMTAEGLSDHPPHRTAASWGGTRTGETGSRRVWIGLAAAALIGAGAVVLLGQRPGSTPAVGAPSGAATVNGAATPPVPTSSPVTEIPAQPAASAAAPAGSSAAAGTGIAPVASAVAATPSATVAARPATNKPATRSPAKKPPRPAAQKPVTPAPSDGISDFGGRR